MTEQFANAAQSKLAADVDASQTSLVLLATTTFSQQGTFRVVVDAEIMIVTAVSPGSSTLTVERGAEGTTPAQHAANALVTQILTAGALANALASPTSYALATQAEWHIDPTNGVDSATGADGAHPIKTLAEMFRRVGSPWIVSTDVDVFLVSYPPETDPLRLLVKFWQRVATEGPTLTIHPPPLVPASTGVLSAVTPHVVGGNVPWEVVDGTVDTSNDVAKRIRITGGARAGARAWIAKSTGPGRRRTSTWAAWSATNPAPTIVTPQAGDPYVVESSGGKFLFVDFIEVLPGVAAPFPSTCSLHLDGLDLHPLTEGGPTVALINAGCALDIANCLLGHGEWYVRTRVLSGDNISGFTIVENCCTVGGDSGQNNIMFLEGTFIDNFVWGGLFGGALWARQGGQLQIDYDALGQGGTLAGVPGFFVSPGSAMCVLSAGLMDQVANVGAVIVTDGVLACRTDDTISGNVGLWGSSASSGSFGVDVRAGGTLRYETGFPLTITGAAGDFQIGNSTTARAWDDVGGAYTANIACTWTNLVGGSLKDNAHCLMRNAHAYLNTNGNAQP